MVLSLVYAEIKSSHSNTASLFGRVCLRVDPGLSLQKTRFTFSPPRGLHFTANASNPSGFTDN